jgi:hypothetical protein
MVASTHVAVDNVLLKLMAPSGQGLKEVIPVRVGRGEKVDPKVQSRLLDQFLLDEITRMLASLAAAEQAGSAGASVQLMGKSLRKLEKELRDKVRGADQDPLAKLILASANFVCGTSLGILQHPTIRCRPYVLADGLSSEIRTNWRPTATTAKSDRPCWRI